MAPLLGEQHTAVVEASTVQTHSLLPMPLTCTPQHPDSTEILTQQGRQLPFSAEPQLNKHYLLKRKTLPAKKGLPYCSFHMGVPPAATLYFFHLKPQQRAIFLCSGLKGKDPEVTMAVLQRSKSLYRSSPQR